jgi:hypothetical protein
MALKTKAGITRKPKIVEHQKSGYLTAKIVQFLMACIRRKQKIAEHQKLGYLSAKIVQYLTLKTKAGNKEGEDSGASEIGLFRYPLK